MKTAAILKTTFEPSELAFLQHVFNELCAEHGLHSASLDANTLAARIFKLYQYGIRDAASLQMEVGDLFPARLYAVRN